MNGTPPPLLYAAYLLVWGYYAALPVVAVGLAIVLESARWVRWRWQIGDWDFDRTVDLTNVLFIVATVYLFSRDGAHGIFSLVGWMPMLMFPLVLVQTYSARGAIPAGALFLSLRRQRRRPGSGASRALHLGYPYLALCLMAAAASVPRDPYFYPLMLMLAVWTLAGIRPPRSRHLVWVVALLVAAGLGWMGQMGMRALQTEMEELVLAWIGGRMRENRDPYRTVSAIGHIGQLKLSDGIVLHVTGRPADAPTLLLRQASYQRYAYGVWTAPQRPFEAVKVGGSGADWRLMARPAGESLSTRISARPRKGRALLALPPGTFRLHGLAAEQVLQNALGTVKTEGSPGFIFFEALHSGEARRDRPPQDGDLQVATPYGAVMTGIVDDLGLRALDVARTARRLEAFFEDGFSYSLWQSGRRSDAPPLVKFLTTERHGHCEYFATATVLLLRAAGIPARYATGYAVEEFNPLVGHHVVRHRHAHAWAQAWDGTAWRDLDFTPPVWPELEEAQTAPWWQPAADLVARVEFLFKRWLWREDSGTQNWTLWLLPPLVALLMWRLARQRRVRREPAVRDDHGQAPAVLPDTPLMALYPALTEHLGPRPRGQTLIQWLGQAEGRQPRTALPYRELRDVVRLHNRLRFGTGDEATAREALARRCADLAPRLGTVSSRRAGD
ncbi:MAG: transglutaminase-like domain-containing protein [Gammaproteobacteria bacterium]|nr:transglutaminase-like domain-containing protein [Gammaproteobacteria bacterium]